MEGTVLVSSSLNLWATDFKSNERKIIESIVQSKRFYNAKIRLGSSCEVSSMSCEDHFSEPDTVFHSWQVLASILEVTQTPPYTEILCIVGMPVVFRGSIFNSAVVLFNGKIIAIKPKTVLSNDLLTREKRVFTAWKAGYQVFDYDLPSVIQQVSGQKTSRIGNVLIQAQDGFLVGIETLDEAKAVVSTSTQLYLMGAHIVCCLGSHAFTLQDKDSLDAVKTITDKSGGVYMYSSQVGFDGNRSCFEGGSLILNNGAILASTQPFSLHEVNLAVASVDLTTVDSYRGCLPSRNLQSAQTKSFEIIQIPDFYLNDSKLASLTKPIRIEDWTKDQLVGLVSSSFLWDYLRKSGAAGFFVGMEEVRIGNSSLLAILREMSCRVFESFQTAKGFNRKCLELDLVRIVGKVPTSPEEIIKEISYSGMFFKDSEGLKHAELARRVAEGLGGRFISGDIESIINAYVETFQEFVLLKVKTEGVEQEVKNQAVSSLQSRVSMVLSYISGQLLTMAYGKKGFLIVLGSTSLEQNLCGTHVKYGLSSGDVNPVGCISEKDLRNYLQRFSAVDGVSEVLNQPPTLLVQDKVTHLTADEVEYLARLRKIEKLGPFRAFLSCLNHWQEDPLKTSQKVKLFFQTYSKNRHKTTVLTPLMQFDASGCDDNRYDLRQFLYNISWTSQFSQIDCYFNTFSH